MSFSSATVGAATVPLPLEETDDDAFDEAEDFAAREEITELLDPEEDTSELSDEASEEFD